MRLRYGLLSLCLLALLLAAPVYAQVTASLTPSKDNTLYAENPDRSNGSGAFLFVGHTAGRSGTTIRRALVAFDVAGTIPAGVTIQSVELVLSVTNAAGGPRPLTLHLATADWGEAGSNAGAPGGQGTAAATNDATWSHAFTATVPWATPGGDFEAGASASTTLDGSGSYTIASSAALVADVQGWLDAPESNFGWVLRGDEAASRTAKRLDSREGLLPPTLSVTYSSGVANEDDTLPDGFHLAQNYPNPFNPTTTIAFHLPAAEQVNLRVFNLLGTEVATLAQGLRPAGAHEVVFSAEGLPSGLYVYRLEAGTFAQTRQMVILK